jgi:hypothetical protein
MPEQQLKIEGRTFKIELDEVQPSFFFPDKGVSLPARIISGYLDGVAQPITVVIPADEFSEERLKQEVKKKAEQILAKKTPIPKEIKL